MPRADRADLAPTNPRLVSPARFPAVSSAAAHYESFYLKACHPAGGLGVWIRYTVHKRPRAEPKGFVWFTLFETSGPLASKAEYPSPIADEAHYIRMGDCDFAPGRVVGKAVSQQLDSEWELQFAGSEPPVWHLPGWMYEAPFPRTKVLSPHPHVTFRGWLRCGDRMIDVDGWPGTVGHNWGAEHAKRAIWIHGDNFEGHEDAWLDLVLGRVAVGPFTTPWIANGELSLDGCRHRLGGVHRLRSTSVEDTIENCRFRLAGNEMTIEGTAGASREAFVGWIYAQPNGGEHQTINCSIADLRLVISDGGFASEILEAKGGAAYELQMEERYPRIPVQPFPDG